MPWGPPHFFVTYTIAENDVEDPTASTRCSIRIPVRVAILSERPDPVSFEAAENGEYFSRIAVLFAEVIRYGNSAIAGCVKSF